MEISKKLLRWDQKKSGDNMTDFALRVDKMIINKLENSSQ